MAQKKGLTGGKAARKEEVMRRITEHQETIARMRNIRHWFSEFSKLHRGWSAETVSRYKKRGDYPLYASYLLPSYYRAKADKEIAAFASLVMKGDGFTGITEMRGVLGDSPRDWFVRRAFVSLGFGDAHERGAGTARNWELSALFNDLHDLSGGGSEPLERCVNAEAARTGVTPECYLENRCKELGFAVGSASVRLLLLSLSHADGLGQSLWDIPLPELRCPLTEDVKWYINTFLPCYSDYGDYDDCMPLFGFDNDVDFFYSVLAYMEMRSKDLPAFKRYEAFYWRSFEEMERYQRTSHWRNMLPAISI